MQLGTKIISCMSALNSGASLTNLPVEIIQKFANIDKSFKGTESFILSILEVSFCVGSAIGCMLVPLYAGRLGYVKSLLMLFCLGFVSQIMSVIPLHWIYLTVARVLTGFCASSLSSLSPLLVAETLNPDQRGKTMMLFSVMLNTGVLLAYVIHYFISFNYNYYAFSFLASAIFCIIGIITTIKLIQIQRKSRKLHTNEQNTQLDTQQVIVDEFNSQNQMGQGDYLYAHVDRSSTFIKTENEESTQAFEQRSVQKQPSVDFNIKLTKTQFSRILYITVALGAMQMFTGVDAIIIYASKIFGQLFNSPKSGIYGSMLLGSVNLIYTFIAVPFAEHKNRRLMLMIGVIGCGAADILIGLTYILKGPQMLIMAIIMIFYLFFNLGPEPIVFMLFSEMFPEKYKVKLNGTGYAVNWSANIISVFIFEFFQHGSEYIVYWLFGVVTLILGISGTILAPETFKKTLIDIEREIRAWTKRKRLIKQNPGRKITNNLVNFQDNKLRYGQTDEEMVDDQRVNKLPVAQQSDVDQISRQSRRVRTFQDQPSLEVATAESGEKSDQLE